MAAPKLKNIRFKNVDARILSIEHISRVLVRWALEPTTQNLKDLKFFIDRGESPEKLEQINTTPILANAIYEYIDYTAKLKDVEKIYYYRVRAVEFSNGTPVQTFYSPLITWEGEHDLVSLYIIEEHIFAHRYVYGVPTVIFKKMKEGAQCSDCWDYILKRSTRSNCLLCKGTGFVDGYYPLIEAWMDFNPDPKQVQIAEFGERQPSQTDIQFTNYPLLNPGDIIVELEPNRYWRVSNVRNTEKNRTTMLQVCRLDEINRSDIEYKLEVPDEVRHRLLDELEVRERTPEF